MPRPLDLEHTDDQALRAYITAQGTDNLRAVVTMPEAPFPAHDNPMFRHLLEVGRDLAYNAASLEEAVAWICAHAWFEGGLAATYGPA